MVPHILRGLPPGYGMMKTVLENLPAPLSLAISTTKLLNVKKMVVKGGEGSAPPAVMAFVPGMTPPAAGTGNKGSNPGTASRKSTCFHSGKPGHLQWECRKRLDEEGGGYKKGGPRGGGHKDKKQGLSGGIAFMAQVQPAPAANPSPSKTWLVDSGASHHMPTGRGILEVDNDGGSCSLSLASGGKAPVMGSGTAAFERDAGTVTLQSAYLVPELKENLLSVGRVDKAGEAVVFMGRKCRVYKDASRLAHPEGGADVAEAMDHRRQYMVGKQGPSPKTMVAFAAVKGTAVVWHRRVFHLGCTNLERAEGMVLGMPV